MAPRSRPPPAATRRWARNACSRLTLSSRRRSTRCPSPKSIDAAEANEPGVDIPAAIHRREDRPLEAIYPIMWLAENEGAKFRLPVLTELRQRRVQEIDIASMDGLKGLPEAVNTVLPRTLTQLRSVHLVRASLRYVNAKARTDVVAALMRVYHSATAEEAATGLDTLQGEWGDKYRAVVRPLEKHHSILPVSARDPQGDLYPAHVTDPAMPLPAFKTVNTQASASCRKRRPRFARVIQPAIQTSSHPLLLCAQRNHLTPFLPENSPHHTGALLSACS